MQLGQRAQRTGLLRDRVGPDHDLDAVVAQPRRQVEGGGARPRGRPRRSTGRPGRRAPGRQRTCPTERIDRPAPAPARAGQRLMPILSRRRRMTPSRSAHGQMSSAVDAEQVHRRLGDERAGEQLAGPVRGDPGQRGALGRRSSPTSRPTMSPSVRPREGRARRTGPRCSGAAPAIRASERIVLRGAHGAVGRAGLGQVGAARAAMSARTCLRSARARPPCPAGRRLQQVAGEPAGAERQAERRVGLLVQPGGELERAAADVDHQQRPLDQPNQRRAARKVSRASSSPREHLRGRRRSRSTDPRRAPRRRWAPRGSRWWRRRGGPRRPGPRRPSGTPG